ncbi:MAG: sodium:solute symporter family protein [Bacteroidetes bacterium]|jgi:SSS family solute:Na+ symporter|nr:sodium:solute symporter family protein [Bacteroidota bacterium]
MSDTTIYWVFAILFLTSMVGIGAYQFFGLRSVDNRDERAFDFWIGEGDVPGWWTAASLTAGWLLLGWMTWQMYLWYTYGAGAIWLFTVPWILCTVGLLFVPRLFRRFPGVSIPEILRFRFDRLTQTLLGPVQSFAYLTWLAAEIYVLSAVLSRPLEVEVITMAVIVSCTFGTYVTLGGFRSVLRTDLIQFGCAAVMLAALTGFGIQEAASRAGSLAAIVPTINETPPMYADHFWDWDSPGLSYMIAAVLIYTPGFITLQGAWQRIMATSDVKEAATGMWWNVGFNVIIVVLMPTLIAIAALVIFPPVGGEVPDAVGSYGYFIFSSMITELFANPLVAGALIVALMGMALSSVDTYVNVCAMNLTKDVLEPLVFERYDVSGTTRLNVGRGVTAGFIGLALLWAFEFPGLFDMYFLSSALLSATTAVAVFSVFSKKTTTLSAYLAMILGTVGTFLFFFLEKSELLFWLPGWLTDSGLAYGVIGLAMAVTGIAVGIVYGTPPSDRVLARYDGAYFSGRREMFEMNLRMKEEESG